MYGGAISRSDKQRGLIWGSHPPRLEKKSEKLFIGLLQWGLRKGQKIDGKKEKKAPLNGP